ncbi:enoyl-CoA hydratase/isomerase family protein [Natrononativus amylolyticus]|uniref:enoyl-CoA hydratase/isomerase family protein n=1 Tax=Natrononativus amylolyticus TaxID=2963434 RepID=UPI0020CDA8A0|nr:enoyl-CoA hydratase/isomerase family protein [Natrononativus amylolyticus]
MVNAGFSIEDGIARIELQRPEALNAVDMPTKREIIDRVQAYKTDDDVRVVVFQSEGETFCAGGDVKEAREREYALEPFTESWNELFEAMMGLGKPTVARIDGYTLGGGFDLMLHTDIPIAAEDAQLGQPEVGLGIVNHFSPPMLQAKVGLTKTLDMMLTGETISGEEADRRGLVARSVPSEDLDDEVDAVAESLAAKSPRVLRKLKDGIYATAEMSPRAGRSYLEAVSLEAAREDPDYEEGVSAQLEDREPEWE